MDAERWARIQELFHDAAELPAAERSTYLETACQDDPSLSAEVIQLLEEDSRQGGFLNRGLPEVAGSVFSASIPGWIADSREFAPYRLLKVLGEGGMGIVFLAERADLGNRVAIKVLRDAQLSPARLERFAAEQRMLAQLNHPSIGRLYDAHTLSDGTPYFVMEYVEGLPLTEHCRQHKAPLETRLKLFRAVCEAVQHAHSHALIHRDLKPSNILVGLGDIPKLLDFGIAKQLDAGTQTLTGLRLMTPAYAAPEQLRGREAGIRTDVYSLGVILYELIADQPPFDLSTRTPGEAELIILNQQPERPSALARKSAEWAAGAPAVAWGDLDALCRAALHKEPARRYQSVEALLRDIGHYCNGEPLEARTDGFAYKAGKFLRRNRRPVLASAAVLLVLLGLVGFFVARLAKSRSEALAQAERAQRIQQFMMGLFETDSSIGPASELKAVDVLDRGAAQARSLHKYPEIQAELYQTLGDLYEKLGKLDRASGVLLPALALRKLAFGKESAPVAETMLTLAMVRAEQGKMREGKQLAEQGLAIANKALAAGDVNLARDEQTYGAVLETSGDPQAALPHLQAALQTFSRPGERQEDLAKTLNAVATVNYDLGKISRAKEQYEQALALKRTLYGKDYPLVAADLVNLGSIDFALQDFKGAEAYYRHGLAISRAWYGEQNMTVATEFTLLGQDLVKLNQLAEANTMLRQALGIHEKVSGKVNSNVAHDLNALATLEEKLHQWTAAETDFKQVLAIDHALYGKENTYIAMALNNLADFYARRGDYARAETDARQALKMAKQVLSPSHLYTGAIHLTMGKILLKEKRYSEAEPLLLAAYSIFGKQGNPKMHSLQDARQALAADYSALHQPEQAKHYKAELALESAPR